MTYSDVYFLFRSVQFLYFFHSRKINCFRTVDSTARDVVYTQTVSMSTIVKRQCRQKIIKVPAANVFLGSDDTAVYTQPWIPHAVHLYEYVRYT